MKYILVIILLMFMFVGSAGNAQTFRDNNNMQLGKVESDGTVRNANNMRIGTISSDGTIRDNNNMKIGTASGINPKYAAVLFFFDFRCTVFKVCAM